MARPINEVNDIEAALACVRTALYLFRLKSFSAFVLPRLSLNELLQSPTDQST